MILARIGQINISKLGHCLIVETMRGNKMVSQCIGLPKVVGDGVHPEVVTMEVMPWCWLRALKDVMCVVLNNSIFTREANNPTFSHSMLLHCQVYIGQIGTRKVGNFGSIHGGAFIPIKTKMARFVNAISTLSKSMALIPHCVDVGATLSTTMLNKLYSTYSTMIEGWCKVGMPHYPKE